MWQGFCHPKIISLTNVASEMPFYPSNCRQVSLFFSTTRNQIFRRQVKGEKTSKTSRQFDGYQGILAWTIFDEIIFGWQNSCPISTLEFGEVHFTLKFYGDTSTGRWSTKMWKKLAKLHWRNFLENLVTLPFYPWNRTERWISQPVFRGSQSPSDNFWTFWDLH